MAHFAQIDSDNRVFNVIVVNNNELLVDGVEQEIAGILFCKNLLGSHNRFVQTSYNGSFRKNFAGQGFTYDSERDAFIPPKPFNSWVLNETTCRWDAPVAMPEDAGTGEPPKRYTWDEDTVSWSLVME